MATFRNRDQTRKKANAINPTIGKRHRIIWDAKKRQARAYHRVLVERVLGRSLRPDEVVHHKDRNKYNNRLSNFQILPRSEHARLHQKRFDVCQAKTERGPCSKPHHARGLCMMHAKRFYRTQLMPELVKRTRKPSTVSRTAQGATDARD